MGGKMDKAKGRLKEAAADVIDEPKLKHEGRQDHAKGEVKEKVDKVVDKASEAIDKISHSRKRTVNQDNM